MDNIKIRIPLTVSQRQQTIPLGVQAGGGGTRNYNALANKPAINGVELVGNKSFEDLGELTITNVELQSIINDQYNLVFGGG